MDEESQKDEESEKGWEEKKTDEDEREQLFSSKSGRNYYEVLGLDPFCKPVDIKRAYKQMALKYHPDRVPPDQKEESTARFREVKNSYEVLSDLRQRIKYDHEMGIEKAKKTREDIDNNDWGNDNDDFDRWNNVNANKTRKNAQKDVPNKDGGKNDAFGVDPMGWNNIDAEKKKKKKRKMDKNGTKSNGDHDEAFGVDPMGWNNIEAERKKKKWRIGNNDNNSNNGGNNEAYGVDPMGWNNISADDHQHTFCGRIRQVSMYDVGKVFIFWLIIVAIVLVLFL